MLEEMQSEDEMRRNSSLSQKGQTFRPITRAEKRQLWFKEYSEQDLALQMWVNLLETQDLEIEMMVQMHGLLVFGVMVSTLRYTQFYIELNEELHRQSEPETADALKEYYTSLLPSPERQEFGEAGLPVIYRVVHMRDVTIMNGARKIKVPYWRGKISEIDAFVIGASAGE